MENQLYGVAARDLVVREFGEDRKLAICIVVIDPDSGRHCDYPISYDDEIEYGVAHHENTFKRAKERLLSGQTIGESYDFIQVVYQLFGLELKEDKEFSFDELIVLQQEINNRHNKYTGVQKVVEEKEGAPEFMKLGTVLVQKRAFEYKRDKFINVTYEYETIDKKYKIHVHVVKHRLTDTVISCTGYYFGEGEVAKRFPNSIDLVYEGCKNVSKEYRYSEPRRRLYCDEYRCFSPEAVSEIDKLKEKEESAPGMM